MKTKEDNKELLKLQIDIRTDNDNLYQELALLFDKPRFLDLLPDLRRTYKVDKRFPLENFEKELDNHLHGDHYMEGVKVNLSKYIKAWDLKKSFPDFYEFLSDKGNNMPEMLDAECHMICYEFDRPPYFVEAIEQAIFCGAVDDTHFKPTAAEVVDFGEMAAWPVLDRVAIFVSPTSTYNDVKKEFQRAKELMNNDDRLYYYRTWRDHHPNIRRYRTWYWIKEIESPDTTYQKISDDWANKHEEDENLTYIDVLKGVDRYKDLLDL